MNRPLTPDEAEDMRGLVLRCVAEAERDRLIGLIVNLERKLDGERAFRREVITRCEAMLSSIEKKIDASGKFCDTAKP